MEEKIIQLEQDMWEAALHRDVGAFEKLVAPDAVMVCGGYRCLGREYARFIAEFYISGYSLSQIEVVDSSRDQVILHYILKVAAQDSRAQDLAGVFHVVSVWKRTAEAWQLIFNMDSRIPGIDGE